MLKRVGGYLFAREEPAPEASAHLEREGYAVLRGVLHGEALSAARAEILHIYETEPAG